MKPLTTTNEDYKMQDTTDCSWQNNIQEPKLPLALFSARGNFGSWMLFRQEQFSLSYMYVADVCGGFRTSARARTRTCYSVKKDHTLNQKGNSFF